METNGKTLKFIKRVTHAEIGTSTKLAIDLQSFRSDFGDNLNTLFVTNTDTGSDIEVYLDGEKVKFVTANNGVFSFDWEAGINYNFLEIENTNSGAVIATNKVKISVGRTGRV